MELREGLIAAACAAIGALVTALVRVLRKPSSQAEMLKAAQDAVSGMIGHLEKEIERLQERVESLEAENAECRGENRQLWQWAESLEEFLRRRGIDIPAREMPRSFIVLESERVTVLKAAQPSAADVPPRASEDEH